MMESKKSADAIRNLLLKIIIPLAFPLIGSFICDLITNRRNWHSDDDIDSSCISIQLDQSSYGSSSPSIREEEEEEEEEEMESLNRAEILLTDQEIMVAQGAERSSEAADDGALMAEGEEIEILKRAVRRLEDQFHDYCEIKEQESSYQKMQIMCLGMKLELIESNNQRIETAVEEIRASAAEFAVTRVKVDLLQRRFNKTWKRSKQELDAVHGRIMAREADMARRCRSFEQQMEEMKLLVNGERKVEVVERRSKEVVDGMEAIRERWAADMEELIYLGWITAWLQHDLLVVSDGSGSNTAVVLGGNNDDDDGPVAMAGTEREKGEKMVAVAAPTSEVELCKAASSSSAAAAAAAWEEEEACVGRAGCGTGIGRPRLIRRLRGWASKGKGGST